MKRHGIASLLAASALLLTACLAPSVQDYVDYEAVYKDYLDYSLGPGYTFSSAETEMYADGTHVCHRNVQYYQETLGSQRGFRLDAYDDLYSTGRHLDSVELYNDYNLLDALYQEANGAAMHEFSDKVLTNYFRVPEFYQNIEINPIIDVMFRSKTYYLLLAEDEAMIPMMQAALEPGTGLQVCTASLQSIAQDKTLIPTFEILITEREHRTEKPVNPEQYIEKMEHIYQDYLRETEAPENYRFSVVYMYYDYDGNIKESRTKFLFDKAALTGIGTFSASERYDVSYFKINEKMQEELRGILTQQS